MASTSSAPTPAPPKKPKPDAAFFGVSGRGNGSRESPRESEGGEAGSDEAVADEADVDVVGAADVTPSMVNCWP